MRSTPADFTPVIIYSTPEGHFVALTQVPANPNDPRVAGGQFVPYIEGAASITLITPEQIETFYFNPTGELIFHCIGEVKKGQFPKRLFDFSEQVEKPPHSTNHPKEPAPGVSILNLLGFDSPLRPAQVLGCLLIPLVATSIPVSLWAIYITIFP